MRAKIVGYQQETGHLYNLEATPAEGTTYRFAKEDRKRFPDILQAGTAMAPYYTNSTQLPVGFTDDPFEALTRQEPMQTRYTGGTVLHLYMNERISSPEACKALVRTALTRFRLPYITITPTFSICPLHGYLRGRARVLPQVRRRAARGEAGGADGVNGSRTAAVRQRQLPWSCLQGGAADFDPGQRSSPSRLEMSTPPMVHSHEFARLP